MTERVLFVPDISCDHCKSSIESAVSELPGIGKVAVDISERTVGLTFDEAQISLETIIEAMAEVGYEVPTVN